MTKFTIKIETEKSFEDVVKAVQKMKLKYLEEVSKIIIVIPEGES